jgi:hypothetical protein
VLKAQACKGASLHTERQAQTLTLHIIIRKNAGNSLDLSEYSLQSQTAIQFSVNHSRTKTRKPREISLAGLVVFADLNTSNTFLLSGFDLAAWCPSAQ